MLVWLGPILAFLLAGFAALWLKSSTTRMAIALRAQSDVLKGATVTLHEVVRVSPPELPVHPAGVPDEEWKATLTYRERHLLSRPYPIVWYRLDVTIIPQILSGPVTLWEPAQLTYVAGYTLPGSLPLERSPGEEQPVNVGFSYVVEVWQEDGTWRPYDQENEDGTYDGPQRLRLLVGINEGTTSLRFQYYFEVFGLIELPATDI